MSAVMNGWYPVNHDDRTFYYAIAGSLVLHALLLFTLPGLREGRQVLEPAGVLVARITAPPAPQPKEPAAQPVEPPKPRVEPTPRLPPVHKPSPIAQPPEPAPKLEPALPAIAAEPPPSAPPAATAATAAIPGPLSQPEAPAGVPANANLGSLREFETQLSFAAQRYRTYPRVAIDNAWQGTVELEIVIGANGLIRSMSVKTSSGRPVLDEEAKEMFRKAKRLVPVPPALTGREFTIVRVVVFDLKQGG
jgi:protein TonB